MSIEMKPFPNMFVYSPTNPEQLVITANQQVTWELVYESVFNSAQGGFLDQITDTSCRFNPPNDSLLGLGPKQRGFVIARSPSGEERRFSIQSV